ncbi:MAG: peptidoglycan-binding domain-containing protein [Candidatus Sulfotelmatobacter sp.]
MIAAGVLAMVCAGFSPVRAHAETDAASDTAAAKKSAGAPKTIAKKRPSASASGSKASSSSQKTHVASHSAADKHGKSTPAVAAHSTTVSRVSSRKPSKKKSTVRGQQKIDPERAQAIQEALIREHYLTGEPAGSWNQESEDAMRRYQADHGWQAKTVPDSRALISLGLGPSHDHLLNPESAMTSEPDLSHAASVSSSQIPASHSADPGSRVSPASTSSEHALTSPQ